MEYRLEFWYLLLIEQAAWLAAGAMQAARVNAKMTMSFVESAISILNRVNVALYRFLIIIKKNKMVPLCKYQNNEIVCVQIILRKFDSLE